MRCKTIPLVLICVFALFSVASCSSGEQSTTSSDDALKDSLGNTSVTKDTSASSEEQDNQTKDTAPTATPTPTAEPEPTPTRKPWVIPTAVAIPTPLPIATPLPDKVTPVETPSSSSTLFNNPSFNRETCENATGKMIQVCTDMAVELIKSDPQICDTAIGMLAYICTSPGSTSQQPMTHGSSSGDISNPCTKLSGENKRRCDLEIANDPMFGGSGVGYVKNFDPNNVPKIAKFNYVELDKLGRTSKFRSVNGHDFSFNTSEYDPTGKNCRSMKHYMVPLGAPRKNADYNSTPHAFEWMSIKFFAPANGVIGNVEDKQEHGELEQQFTIQSTEYPGYYFGFYHVKLAPSLGNGSEVKAGQQIGTLGNEESYAEISVEARINSRETHLMSFLEVATDEVFEEYKARGVNSLSDVIITKEERDARPYGCDRNSEAGWFDGSYNYNADIAFMTWVYESSEEWFFFDE